MRVFVINAAVLVLALALLALSPATVSSTVALTEVVTLVAGLGVMLAVNVILLRRAFGPLERLTALMRSVEPFDPGRRIDTTRSLPEVAAMGQAFMRCSRAWRSSAARAGGRYSPRRASAEDSREISTTISAGTSRASCSSSRRWRGRSPRRSATTPCSRRRPRARA